MPIPADATTIEFGLRLQQRGVATVRGLRFTVGEALDQLGAAWSEAGAVLDAAIETVKTHALNRDKLSAQTTAGTSFPCSLA
jgi:hypothetical protein